MTLEYKNKTIQMGIWWVMTIAALTEVKIYVYLTLYIRCIIMNAFPYSLCTAYCLV